MQIVAFFAVGFVICFMYANQLLIMLSKPLLQVLPQQTHLVATQLLAPLLTPLHIAINTATLLTAPYALFHLWCFMAPGLYANEKATLRGLVILSMMSFIAGVLFCFYGVLPFLMACLVHALPDKVLFMPDISNTIHFMTRMLLVFGLCFQLPVLCMLLVKMNVLTLKTLRMIRPYVIVGAFIVGMLLTPPDVLSQLMLAIPICLLYELGILLTQFQQKQHQKCLNNQCSSRS